MTIPIMNRLKFVHTIFNAKRQSTVARVYVVDTTTGEFANIMIESNGI